VDVAIREWAQQHNFSCVYPPGSPLSKAKESEIISRIKRTLSAIPTSINITGNQGAIQIGVTGPTASITSGATKYSIGGGWGGDLEFKTQAPGASFSAAISQDSWKLQFVIGRLAPDLTGLDTIFRKGEAAVRGAVGDLNKIDWG